MTAPAAPPLVIAPAAPFVVTYIDENGNEQTLDLNRLTRVNLDDLMRAGLMEYRRAGYDPEGDEYDVYALSVNDRRIVFREATEPARAEDATLSANPRSINYFRPFIVIGPNTPLSAVARHPAETAEMYRGIERGLTALPPGALAASILDGDAIGIAVNGIDTFALVASFGGSLSLRTSALGLERAALALRAGQAGVALAQGETPNLTELVLRAGGLGMGRLMLRAEVRRAAAAGRKGPSALARPAVVGRALTSWRPRPRLSRSRRCCPRRFAARWG